MWLKNANCAGGTKTWQGALDFVAGINSGTYSSCGAGKTDWRLPNVNELESLVNAEESNTATWLIAQGFTNVQSDYYWSGSSLAYYTSSAWVVGMDYGYVYYSGKSNGYYVWPVRSGQ